MAASATKNNRSKKNSYSIDGLYESMRRFAKRCREADAMIRRL